jgi:hypothetical protein
MIGTPLVGAFVAHLAFWVLLAVGLAFGDFGERGAAAFGGLWAGTLSAHHLHLRRDRTK